MKVVILAGGLGTRISEESYLKPKPMIEIGGIPILWHIMKIYSYYGFNEFIICCGHKGNVIKEFFANYFLYTSNVTFDFSNENKMIIHNTKIEPWVVTLVDTGDNTMTGGRVKKIKKYIPKNETFMLTYGDGLSNINISKLIEFHQKEKKVGTLTATQPIGRFGSLNIENNSVLNFQEKPKGDNSWINGGFFVLDYEVFDYIPNGEEVIFEAEPLENLANKNQLNAFKHDDFWHPMDTMKDKSTLENMWNEGKAPWKLWE